MADEPLILEPADRQAEAATNTWWLGADDEDRRTLSASEVVAAFERTASAIRGRVRALGYPGVATFYVWHDEQAGQLRCSTRSLPPVALPFGGIYTPSDDLHTIVEGFLADNVPGLLAWSDLEDIPVHDEQTVPDPDPGIAPFRVWVTDVGLPSH